MKLKVSAIIVTYNRCLLLKQCIRHLLDQTYRLQSIFIINNHSNDNTYYYLDNLNNKKVKVYNTSKNLGGAGGFSLGIKLAFENSTSDLFWIMDDDAMPSETALYNLMIASNKLQNNFGFLCSNVRWWNNNDPCNIPNVARDWTKFAKESLIKVNNATFVSILVPRYEIKQLGLPIAQMFIWGDDTEYTTRLSSRQSSYFVSNSLVYHKTLSNRSYETVFNSNRIKYYKFLTRNLLYICRKYFSKKKFVKLLISDFVMLLKVPFKSKDQRCKRLYYIIVGIIDGLIFNPVVKYPSINNKN